MNMGRELHKVLIWGKWRMASKKIASVYRSDCVACGTCLMVCRRQAINGVNGCYAEVDSKLCVGCGVCAKVCPTNCITLKEGDDAP